jgi:hypothetical protein
MVMIVHNDATAFSSSIQAFAKVMTRDKFRLVIRKIGLEALTRLVRKTPVDTGRARGNWQVSIGTPNLDYDDEMKDPSGGEAEAGSGGMAPIRAGDAVIKTAPLDSIIWITNNLPYIQKLDEGGSHQAPTGMVDSTMLELQTMFERDHQGEASDLGGNEEGIG